MLLDTEHLDYACRFTIHGHRFETYAYLFQAP